MEAKVGLIVELVVAFVLVACRSESVVEPATQFTVSPRDALIQEGMRLQLKPLVATDGSAALGTVQWSSSAATIASVDANGLVTAVATGTTIIKAESGTFADSTTIEVQQRSGSSLTSGGNLTCGLTMTSGAACWGDNAFGQTGTALSSLVVVDPTAVVAGVPWKSLAASWNHACGVDANADLHCWGLNTLGQLGTGKESDPARFPARVAGEKKFVSVAAGGSRWVGLRDIEITDAQETCGLTTEGEAYCWGLPGDFTISGETSSPMPRPAAPGIRFASISVGYAYVCGISIDRRAYCWGNNDLGQLGRTRATFDRGPKPVEGDLKFVQISAGGVHTCALTMDGSAYCWGANDGLQLGAASTEQCAYRTQVVMCQAHPVAVTGGYKFTSISAGNWGPAQGFGGELATHSCGITVEHDVVCWGLNTSGQVRFYRDDLFAPKSRPPTLTELAGIKFRSVSAGSSHTCGVTLAGLAYCWGDWTTSIFGPSPFRIGAMEGGFLFK